MDSASLRYAMSRVHRGVLVIISNRNFAITAQLPVRRSADHDVSMLQDAFSRLGFHVVIYCDKTARQMIAIIAESTCSSVSFGWWSGVVVSVLALINELNQRQARLVLRWATVSGFNSQCPTFISVRNQPAIHPSVVGK